MIDRSWGIGSPQCLKPAPVETQGESKSMKQAARPARPAAQHTALLTDPATHRVQPATPQTTNVQTNHERRTLTHPPPTCELFIKLCSHRQRLFVAGAAKQVAGDHIHVRQLQRGAGMGQRADKFTLI
jgi:hypothetical protein